MSDDPLAKVIEDARALIDADRRVVEAIAKSNLDAISNLLDDFGRKKIRVLAALAAHPAVEAVDSETQELLSRVQRKFPTERLVETFTGGNSDLNWFDELSDTEQSDLGFDLLYSWSEKKGSGVFSQHRRCNHTAEKQELVGTRIVLGQPTDQRDINGDQATEGQLEPPDFFLEPISLRHRSAKMAIFTFES